VVLETIRWMEALATIRWMEALASMY